MHAGVPQEAHIFRLVVRALVAFPFPTLIASAIHPTRFPTCHDLSQFLDTMRQFHLNIDSFIDLQARNAVKFWASVDSD